jgi:chemotaxis signal transduction protein
VPRNGWPSGCGLVVDEVYGFRRFLQREHISDFPQTALRADRYLEGAYRRGLEVWPVFRLEKLLQSREFQRAAED